MFAFLNINYEQACFKIQIVLTHPIFPKAKKKLGPRAQERHGGATSCERDGLYHHCRLWGGWPEGRGQDRGPRMTLGWCLFSFILDHFLLFNCPSLTPGVGSMQKAQQDSYPVILGGEGVRWAQGILLCNNMRNSARFFA